MNPFLKHWTFFRTLQLLIGISGVIYGILGHHWPITIVGIAYGLMALFNVGCCAYSNCSVTPPENNSTKQEEVIFEEIKNK